MSSSGKMLHVGQHDTVFQGPGGLLGGGGEDTPRNEHLMKGGENG